MTSPPPPADRQALARQIRRDVLLDTLGNTALVLGLWSWFGADHGWNSALKEPAVFIALTATGLLNLLHLPARLRRLRAWRLPR